MELVWELGESSVRKVLDELNDRSDKQRKYTTILTIMVRLTAKGLLTRRRDGRTDLYRPLVTREEHGQARAQADVLDLVQRHGDAALVLFARQMEGLDPERRRQLRRIARRDPG